MFAYVLAYAAICFMASGHVVLAQNQTFITGLLANLDAQGLTNFTSVVRQVQSDTSEIAYFLSLSDSSSPKTLFVPNNDACMSISPLLLIFEVLMQCSLKSQCEFLWL